MKDKIEDIKLGAKLGLVFKNHRYRWVYREEKKLEEFKKDMGIKLPDGVAEMLVKRSLCNKEDANAFIEAPLGGLRSPFGLIDCAEAVERLSKAVVNAETIFIYGDYDVDGVTSVALVYLFLKESGAKVEYYIPNRLEEGYGLNIEAIDEINRRGANLIVTVDCGINAVNEVEHAKTLGIDIIITDHHQPAGPIPHNAVAVVNPMRADCPYPFKGLAGVGVAFKLVMALRYKLRDIDWYKSEPPNLKKYLDIVTLGTIADVVPIVDENRIFVKHGLKILSGRNTREGIISLRKISGLEGASITTSNVGYVLSPRINAVGRLGHSDDGIKLLITESKKEAAELARILDDLNKSRQQEEKKIIGESYGKIEKHSMDSKYKGIVLYSADWHIGVIGIVASRVVEKFHKPTIVITQDKGVGKGSARSIPGFHLFDGLRQVEDILLSYGGHKYAAGLKIDVDNIDELKERFNNIVKDNLEERDFVPEINIDAMLEPEQLTKEFFSWLEKLEPFGAGNPEPVICMRGVTKAQPFMLVGKDGAHLKGYFEKNGRQFECIGFNMKSYLEQVNENEKFDIIFSPILNGWYSGRFVHIKLRDIKMAEEEWEEIE